MSEDVRPEILGYGLAIEDAGNKEFIIDDILGYDSEESVLGKIKSEIANETIDAVLDYMRSCMKELETAIEEGEIE